MHCKLFFRHFQVCVQVATPPSLHELLAFSEPELPHLENGFDYPDLAAFWGGRVGKW